MSRPIEQVLNNLIPRHSGSLPPELIELASSLLAQSRSKISNLRAEEEIGRTYACANIACERLKTTLNLPSIEPRPPCPPKIYKKLYSHLDKALVTTSSRRRAKSFDPSTPAKTLPQNQAPAKEKSLEGFRSNRTPKRGLKYASNKEKEMLPSWIGPAIRKICTEFDAGKAVPHVWAGVESILYLPCPKDAEDDAATKHIGDRKTRPRLEGKMPALLGAVWFFVTTRLKGKDVPDTKEHHQEKLRMVKVLRGLKEDETMLAKVGDKEEDWKGWEMVTKKNMDHWISEIAERDWNTLEWLTNIEEGSGASGAVENGDMNEDEDVDEEAGERANKRTLRAGLGTMIQPKLDYLSDEKREEYAVWKEAVLAKIHDLAAHVVVDGDMDTTEG